MKVDPREQAAFGGFVARLIGQPVGFAEESFGAAVFIECGALRPGRFFGTRHMVVSPRGSWRIAIMSTWSLVRRGRVLCGADGEPFQTSPHVAALRGHAIVAVTLVGCPPEIDVAFTDGTRLVTMQCVEGEPEWHISCFDAGRTSYGSFRGGRFDITVEDTPL